MRCNRKTPIGHDSGCIYLGLGKVHDARGRARLIRRSFDRPSGGCHQWMHSVHCPDSRDLASWKAVMIVEQGVKAAVVRTGE